MPLRWEIRSNRGKKSELGKMGIWRQRKRNPRCASVAVPVRLRREEPTGPHPGSPYLSRIRACDTNVKESFKVYHQIKKENTAKVADFSSFLPEQLFRLTHQNISFVTDNF